MFTRLLFRLLAPSAALLLAVAQPTLASAAPDSAGEEASSPGTDWLHGDVWSDPNRGFNWYPPDLPPKVKNQTPQTKPSPAPQDIRSMTTFSDVQAELNRLFEQAVFKPSEQNVLAYLRAQEWAMSTSSMYADVARRVVWKNPDIDGNARQPIASYSALAKRERLASQRAATAEQIGQTHGLLFFFRSDCPYCHDFAPVVKSISERYGIQVLPVSLDGRGLPDFPNFRMDNGISRFVSAGEGVRVVPALYLVSNTDKTVALIGTGALAAEEVTERIRVLATTKPGEEM